MSISIPCRGLRLQFIVVTGCLLSMVAMIVPSPSQLRYDEQYILAGFGDRGAKYNAFLLDLILRSAHGRCRILDFLS